LTNDESFTDSQDQPKFFRLGSYDLEILIQLVAKRMLLHSDIVVLFAFISLTDWRSGRCRARLAKVGELLNKPVSTISVSVKRLKDHGLMVPFIDKRTGEKLHIIHPGLLICGSGKQRGFLVKSFMEAVNENRPTMPFNTDYAQEVADEPFIDDLDMDA
jgi:hypothetical protein